MRATPTASSLACLVAALLVWPTPAAAQTALNVLVVINETLPASIEVGEYYVKQRAIPQNQVIRVRAAKTETIDRVEYERTIEAPVGAWLLKQSLQDQILYIVLAKGVPIRVTGTGGRDGTVASVDSELTLLYRKLVGVRPTVIGTVPNPIYLDTQPVTRASRFTRTASDIYLVTRLDGFTVADAIGLIDRASAPTRDGIVVLDQRATIIDSGGDRWLRDAAAQMSSLAGSARVELESTRAVATTTGPILGYYSWGSNDESNRLRQFPYAFQPGAIGAMFVSTDGRTFQEPPADWVPVDTARVGGEFGRGSQSSVGDLIRSGLTGVAAHTNEPFLDATIRPQILFPAYFAGFNIAESFYSAMPYLSWQTMVIGDPLCAPFRAKTLGQEELHRGIDAETRVPALFSERRLAVLAKGGLRIDGLKAALLAEGLIARDSPAEGEKALIRAAELEPRLTNVLLQLAQMNEARNDHAKAVEWYLKVIAAEPQHAVALNNLAFALAEHLKDPRRALPYAEQAHKHAPGPEIKDTLAWTYYLMGDHQQAASVIEQATAAAPRNSEILLHAAVIHAALGEKGRARLELDAATKLNPTLDSRDDVKSLRERIKPPSP